MDTSISPHFVINEKDINKVDPGSGVSRSQEDVVSVPKIPRVISFDNGNLNGGKFGMSTKCHIMKEGTELKDLTRRVFHLMQEKVEQFGHAHLAGILSAGYSPCKALIERVQLGCVKFVLRFQTKEGLQKFWEMYSSGELAKKMTDVFITDELVPGDKSDISVLPTIDKKDYDAGMKYFEDLEKALKEDDESIQEEKKGSPEEQSPAPDQDQPGTSEMMEDESPDTSEYEDPMDFSDEEK